MNKESTLSDLVLKEIALSERIAAKHPWKNDDGDTFECKLCNKVRPEALKSKVRIGWCKLCTAEKEQGGKRKCKHWK